MKKMEFSEKFKTYSNADLLRIIENPDDYQPQASAISAIGSFILAIKWKPSGTALENLFPQTPPISYLLSFLFMSGIIWVISREKIRNVYSISKPTMIFTISIVTGILVVAFGVLSVLTNL